MTTQEETLALTRAWSRGDNGMIRRVIGQIAAHAVAKNGRDTAYSNELRRLAGTSDGMIAEANAVIGKFMDAGGGIDRTGHRLILPESVCRQVDQFVAERSHAGALASHGLSPASRMLLLGGPGTGKTSLAGVLADRLGLPLRVVRLDRLVASHLGETLANIGLLFDQLDRTPCVAFMDEADALLGARGGVDDVGEMRRATNLLLQRLDRWSPAGVLVAASNMSRLLDAAALRRFDVRIVMPATVGGDAGRLLRARFEELGMPVVGLDGDEARAESVASGLSPALVVQTVDGCVRAAVCADEASVDWADVSDRLESARSSGAVR